MNEALQQIKDAIHAKIDEIRQTAPHTELNACRDYGLVEALSVIAARLDEIACSSPTAANNQTDEDRVMLYHVIGQRAEYHEPGVTLEDALNRTRRGEAYAELKVVSVTQVVGTGYYLIPANENDTQEVSK